MNLVLPFSFLHSSSRTSLHFQTSYIEAIILHMWGLLVNLWISISKLAKGR
jgi:hypothetical protein